METTLSSGAETFHRGGGKVTSSSHDGVPWLQVQTKEKEEEGHSLPWVSSYSSSSRTRNCQNHWELLASCYRDWRGKIFTAEIPLIDPPCCRSAMRPPRTITPVSPRPSKAGRGSSLLRSSPAWRGVRRRRRWWRARRRRGGRTWSSPHWSQLRQSSHRTWLSLSVITATATANILTSSFSSYQNRRTALPSPSNIRHHYNIQYSNTASTLHLLFMSL